MKMKTKVALLTAAVAIPAFFAGPILFPPADIGVEPTVMQIAVLMTLSVGDAILLGLGVSFVVFGLPLLRQVSPDSRARAWAMYISIGYLMISWWPHLNMHASNGVDLGGLLRIDLLFHFPLEVAGVVLAYCAFSLFRSWRSGKLTDAMTADESAALAGKTA